jgi:hypothetical protein
MQVGVQLEPPAWLCDSRTQPTDAKALIVNGGEA